MEKLESGESTVVAPHEVRELLERMTQVDTEGVDTQGSRTLAGLAADTGIPVAQLRAALEDLRRGARKRWAGAGTALAATAVAAVAYYGLVFRTPTSLSPIAVAAPAAEPALDEGGLVEMGAVTWGSTQTLGRMADPSFVPTQELPPGLGLAAATERIAWGAGDLHAAVFSRVPTPAESESFRRSAEELLQHVRERARDRRLPPTKVSSATAFRSALPHYAVTLTLQCYGGSATVLLDLPAGNDSRAEVEADRLTRAAARDLVQKFVGELKQGLRFQGLD